MTEIADQKPGCLYGLLRTFGLGANKKSHVYPPYSASESEPDEGANGPLPYRQRDNFLSSSELSFFHVLKLAVGEQALICPKVGLQDIFYVARPNENVRYRNRINRRHVDYLVCHPMTMKPLLAIELDDSSHQRADRQERDEFVDRAFQAADLPLLHVKWQAGYSVQSLKSLLAPFLTLTEHVTSPQRNPMPSEAASSQPMTPLCPKCGIPMVRRTGSRGPYLGKSFFGCQNFPNCRQVIPIAD